MSSLVLDDNVVKNRMEYANRLHELKQYEESEREFESILMQFPTDKDARILYAKRLKNRKKLHRANEVLEVLEFASDLTERDILFCKDIKRLIHLVETLEGHPLSKADDISILSMKHAILHFKQRIVKPVSRNRIGKVSLITGSLGPGGAEKQLAYTAVHLNEIKLKKTLPWLSISEEADVLVKSHESQKENDFFLEFLKEHRVKLFQIDSMKSIPVDKLGVEPHSLVDLLGIVPNTVQYGLNRLTEYFREARTEIAFIWQDGAILFAACAALLAGVPKIILNLRGLPPNLRAHIYREEYYTLYTCLAKIPGVSFVTNNDETAQAYCDWLGLPIERFTVVYNGVIPNAPKPGPVDEELWEQFVAKTRDATHTVGGVFRFVIDKRPVLVIQFINSYLQKHPDARFVLVGHGTLFDECQDLANALEISDRILFIGRSHSVSYWMSKMDALILLSQYEGLPNVLIEAQHQGVPVVSTPAGGSKQCFISGETGYILSDAENPDILEACDRVHELVSSFKSNPGLKNKAIDFANERFSISQMIENTVRVFTK